MSTTANKEQLNFAASYEYNNNKNNVTPNDHNITTSSLDGEFGFQLEHSPNEIPINYLEASLDHSSASLSSTHPTDNVLYDNVETFDIINWNDDVRADQTALLSTRFNHANIPKWNHNSTGDIANTSLDPFTNFQNFTSFEQNTASSNDGYLQGLLDGIDMGINFNWQEMNVLALAPTEQGFISGEVDANTALIGQQATPPAPVIGSFANHVAPAPRFACDSIGCGKTFGRQSDCNRHMRKHGALEYSCPALGCGKEFYRRDKLVDHARRIHQLQL
ncbi:similar to transcription factor Zn, C2H2 [Botrytis cinerea T4]|uniref:C2H2 type master regulator of conidiophore development brlA n=1 Tax=Botryotinia fuckeliana (strain T4) TaxID=999810 RepID=G2XVV3_BOTF4|nr:similar to transcription factor Zn, C2H2 [Botrytis cinerea T4]